MLYTTYLCGGISKQPAEKGLNNGITEVFLYNPTSQICHSSMTAYFADREPAVFLETIETAAEASTLLKMPKYKPQIFEDAGFWGLKFTSDTTLIPILIQVPNEITNTRLDPEWKGGVTHFVGANLSSHWIFPNGIWMDWKRLLGSAVDNTLHPYNEMEDYHFLNPGQTEVQVEMNFQFRDLTPITFQLVIQAQRHLTWCNFGQIPFNQPYALHINSSEPITTCAIRNLYGLDGLDQWGINIRAGMPAEMIVENEIKGDHLI